MKANLIEDGDGMLIRLEDGEEYSANPFEDKEDFKLRIKEHVAEVYVDSLELTEEEPVLEKVSFADTYEAAELEARVEDVELIEGAGDIVLPGVYFGDEKVDAAIDVKAEPINLLDEAKDELTQAQEAYENARRGVKSLVAKVKEACSKELRKAKGALNLAKIAAEDDEDEAEKAYKDARRAVALNNKAGKDSTEQQIDAIAITREALELTRGANKLLVAKAKESLTAVKNGIAGKIEAAKAECLENVEKARLALEESQEVYAVKVDQFTADYQDVVLEAERRVELSQEQIDVAKQALAAARESHRGYKAKLNEAKEAIRKTNIRRTSGAGMTLAQAEAEAEAGKVNKGKVIYFCPNGTEEPIKVKIKSVTTDRRVNLSYYRMVAAEASEGVEEGKLFHGRISRIGLDLSAIEVT